METFRNLSNEEINAKMQELLDSRDYYAGIDNKGDLTDVVDDNTQYIVDVNADEQKRYCKDEDEMMCIMDREGENYYVVSVNRWW